MLICYSTDKEIKETGIQNWFEKRFEEELAKVNIKNMGPKTTIKFWRRQVVSKRDTKELYYVMKLLLKKQ